MDESKILECPHCGHEFTYDEWQVEDSCPFCKHNEGFDLSFKSRKND